jgi:hypothetical protein
MDHYQAHTYGDGSSSRSLAAQDAETEGRLPLTRAIAALRAKSGRTAKDCRSAILRANAGSTEWHHTGSHARRTSYYEWDVDFADAVTLAAEAAERKARIRAEMAAEKLTAEARFAPLRAAILAELAAVVLDPPAPWRGPSGTDYPDSLPRRLQARPSYRALGVTPREIEYWPAPKDIRDAAHAANVTVESQPAWQAFLAARAGGAQ